MSAVDKVLLTVLGVFVAAGVPQVRGMQLRRSMNPILVVFESRFGHCATVAEHVAERIRDRALLATVLHVGVANGADVTRYSGIVVVAPVYFGGYPQPITRFLRRRQVALAAHPFAFVSVGNGATSVSPWTQQTSERRLHRLVTETGVTPDFSTTIAGAISYPRYGAFLRLAMKLHAFITGAPTDTARTHELTDWAALDHALLPFFAVFHAANERESIHDFDESGIHRVPEALAVLRHREG